MALKIITDYKWKNFLYGYELPKSKRKDFDYISNEDFDTHSFIRYRRQYYDLGEFMLLENLPNDPDYKLMKKYNGYLSDSYFSGVLIKVSNDGEQYQIATYYS